MSSHREAPETAKDPVADSTDVYAFVSPDRPDTVTMIANYIPFQAPDGGPNFYEFGDDVTYDIHVANKGKGEADITYRFHFHTKVRNPKTFLYNTGQITSLDSPTWNGEGLFGTSGTRSIDATTWNRPQFYSVTRVKNGNAKVLARRLACPPVNIGPRSTPNYADLAAAAVHKVGRRRVFAGQRADAFHVDLGSIFDLGALRPFENLHLIPSAAAAGVNSLQGFNVHSIALQVPITEKDTWNAHRPKYDKSYAKFVNHPELAKLLPVLYPGVFPHLAAYHKPRADLNAILLTGIPSGVVPGFQNYTGPVEADMLRLNLAIPPASSPNDLGLVAGDPAGYPNGRRVDDDVVTIEVRAVAGITIPLVDPSYTVDGAASVVQDGTSNTNTSTTDTFPFLGNPGGGYQTQPGSAAV